MTCVLGQTHVNPINPPYGSKQFQHSQGDFDFLLSLLYFNFWITRFQVFERFHQNLV